MSRSVHESDSPARTHAIAAGLGSRLAGGDVVALVGDLGSGKTCFVRGLAEGLGIDPAEVSSPTFTICRRHEGPRVALVHVDAWRIGGAADLESIGWEELSGPATVVAVEWADRVAAALPPRRIEVRLEHTGPDARRIAIEGPAGCPSCGRPVPPGDPHAPFCSRRCRRADLGRWMQGEYRIARPVGPEDQEP